MASKERQLHASQRAIHLPILTAQLVVALQPHPVQGVRHGVGHSGQIEAVHVGAHDDRIVVDPRAGFSWGPRPQRSARPTQGSAGRGWVYIESLDVLDVPSILRIQAHCEIDPTVASRDRGRCLAEDLVSVTICHDRSGQVELREKNAVIDDATRVALGQGGTNVREVGDGLEGIDDGICAALELVQVAVEQDDLDGRSEREQALGHAILTSTGGVSRP